MAKVKVQQTKSNTYCNIPKEIIDYLTLKKGDEVIFRIKDNGSIEFKKIQ